MPDEKETPSVNGPDLGAKIMLKAKENGADPEALVASQIGALISLAEDAAAAIHGDARVQAHVEAMFRLRRFSAAAEAWLEGDAWWSAIKETLEEFALTAATVAMRSVAQSLVQSMVEGERD